MLANGEIVIGGHNWHRYANSHPEGQSRGLIPRDYTTHPRGYLPTVQAVDFPTIPRSEWSERCREMEQRKSRLSDILRAAGVPCLDQNGRGYCWFHSGTGAVMATRAVMNQPTIGLSAYSGACKIKNFRDEGGWGAQGADFLVQYGVCDEMTWPQRATDRSLDNPASWQNALQYRLAVQLADMQAAQYDRNLTFEQYMTLWLLRNPTIDDHNWWGHSIFGCDPVDGVSLRDQCRCEISGKLLSLREFDLCWSMDDPVTAGFGGRIRNSWGASWGDQGFGVLAGSKAVPDGGVGVLIVLAS